MSDEGNGKPPIADGLAELLRKAIISGGATVGGLGAVYELFINNEGEVLTAVASAGIGLALSYGAAMLKPFHAANQRRAGVAGKRIDAVTEGIINAATGFEGKYLKCQASDCESVRAEGMQQREGIFEPLLKDVFVELQIDSTARLPGLMQRAKAQVDLENIRNQTIWDFLADSRREKAFRQLAILAWGGFGKTTLLKNIRLNRKLPDSVE